MALKIADFFFQDLLSAEAEALLASLEPPEALDSVKL